MKNFIKYVFAFVFVVGTVVAVACLVASWICDIDPTRSYSWTGGIWHGLFFIPNWVRSLFCDALYKANAYSAGYNVWWWISTITMSTLGLRIGYFGYNIILALIGSLFEGLEKLKE